MTNFEFVGNSTTFDVDFGEAYDFSDPEASHDEIMKEVDEALDEIRDEEDSRPSNLLTDEEGGATISLKASENMSIIDKLKTVTGRGVYTVFVQAGCPDNPPEADGSLSGWAHVRLTEEDADYLHAWVMLIDQNGVMFTRNVADDGDGEWVIGGGGSAGNIDLPEITEEDDGKVLMISGGKIVAAELPSIEAETYTGDYEVTPDADETQVLYTAKKYLYSNITVEKIPYAEVTNPSDGITVTIG